MNQRDQGAFIPVADYRRKVLGASVDQMQFKDQFGCNIGSLGPAVFSLDPPDV